MDTNDLCVYRSVTVRKAQYKELIDKFPIGIFVWHLENPNDETSFKCLSANIASELIVAVDCDPLGKYILELFPETNPKFLHSLRETAISKPEQYNDFVENVYGSDTFRTKSFSLPDGGVAVLFETIDRVEDALARREGWFASISTLFEDSIENIMTDGSKHSESGVLCKILCHMLNFITKTKVLGSVHVASAKEKVQHATIFELCDRLLLPDLIESDSKFESSMLITYRYFASPVFLMSLLVFRFMTLSFNCKEDRVILRVQLRIIHFILNWLDNHFYDFLNSDRLLHIFNMFIELVVAKSQFYQIIEWKNALSMVLDHQMRKYKRSTFLLDPVQPHTPINAHIDILNYRSADIAHQLTLLYMERFQYIMPYEFSHAAWTRSNSGDQAPNITDIIRLTNRLSQWCISAVVASENTAKMLKQFVEIAYDAFSYNDFETTFALTQALQNTPVARLSESWKELDSKTTKHWQKLLAVTAPTKNFKKYREHYNTISMKDSTPIIPYFGVLLKDIFFIDEGNEDFVNATNVNFEKMEMLASYISKIIAMQKNSFKFTPSLVLKAYLLYDTLILSEEDQYNTSTKNQRTALAKSATSLKGIISKTPKPPRKTKSMTINREFDMTTTASTIRKKELKKKSSADDFSIAYDSLLIRSTSTRRFTTSDETLKNLPIIKITPDFANKVN